MPFKETTRGRSEWEHGGNSHGILQGLQTTLAQLAITSERQTETLQNLREDLILRSVDEEIDDISDGNSPTGGNTLVSMTSPP